MKNSLRYSLIAALVLLGTIGTGLSQTALAAGQANLSATRTSLTAGEQFTVHLSVAETPGLYGAQLSLTYDAARLKVIEVRPGAAWPTATTFVVRNLVTPQSVEFAATLFNTTGSVSGDLVAVTFEALGANAAVTTTIKPGASLPFLFADHNGTAIPMGAPAPLVVSIVLAPPPTHTPAPTHTPMPTKTPSPTHTPLPTQTPPPPPPACVSATITLQAGWNLVTLPVVPAAGLTADGLLQMINSQGGSATVINRWQAGGWQSHMSGLPFNRFAIVAGRAFFVKTASASTFTICGAPPATSSVIALVAGWNLLTIPASAPGLFAESLAKALDPKGASVTEIAGWSGGSWVSHPRGLPFNNFAVQPGQAYFVRASQPLNWAP